MRCGAGGKISPNTCDKLTQWILESSAKGKDPPGGD